MTAPRRDPTAAPDTLARRPVVAAAGVLFAVLFWGGNVLADTLTSAELPRPGAPDAEVAAYYAVSGTSSLVRGTAQMLAAAALALLVTVAAARRTGSGPAARAVAVAGWVAVAGLAGSALLTIVLAAAAPTWAPGTVGAVRTAGFLTGGVVHVVALGLFVRGAATTTGASAGVRRFGYVAAVPAVASVVSLAWFPASILLPIGRLLCTLWCVVAGFVLARGPARETR